VEHRGNALGIGARATSEGLEVEFGLDATGRF
jgi:hypothetical protein